MSAHYINETLTELPFHLPTTVSKKDTNDEG